jgi:DNA-binding PadR family transcriptional regulator
MARVARPCRACGEKILFAPSPSGRTLPLQRVRTVYTLMPDGEARAEEFREGVELYVSHWETCAKRDEIKRQQAARKEGA